MSYSIANRAKRIYPFAIINLSCFTSKNMYLHINPSGLLFMIMYTYYDYYCYCGTYKSFIVTGQTVKYINARRYPVLYVLPNSGILTINYISIGYWVITRVTLIVINVEYFKMYWTTSYYRVPL